MEQNSALYKIISHICFMTNLGQFFESEIILENERARLSPLSREHIAELSKIAFEPALWKLSTTRIEKPEDLKNYIDTALEERAKGQSYPFLIFDKQIKRVAGCTRYGAISLPNKRLEIGWTWLHPSFHGSGLNKSCKFLLLKFAFEELGLNRVELKTDVLNWQSRKAMLKLGAVQEGIFRKHIITDTGRVRNSIYFSFTNDDWPGLKQTVFADL